MEPAAVLAELRAMASCAPDFDHYSPSSQAYAQWLGRTHSLVAMVNTYDAVGFRVSADNLASSFMRGNSVATIMNVLHRAIGHLESSLPNQVDQVFGPGAVYDFMRALRDLVVSATSSLLVVDPYLDDQVFDAYISESAQSIRVRMLTSKHTDSLRPALAKFNQQYGRSVEIHRSSGLHDRLLFIDDRSCWLIGHSIKDGAENRPTYIAPLSTEMVAEKLRHYEDIWQRSTSIV